MAAKILALKELYAQTDCSLLGEISKAHFLPMDHIARSISTVDNDTWRHTRCTQVNLDRYNPGKTAERSSESLSPFKAAQGTWVSLFDQLRLPRSFDFASAEIENKLTHSLVALINTLRYAQNLFSGLEMNNFQARTESSTHITKWPKTKKKYIKRTQQAPQEKRPSGIATLESKSEEIVVKWNTH